MKVSLHLAALTMSAAIALVGCGSDEPPSPAEADGDPASTASEPAATVPQEITIAFPSDADGLDKAAIGEESIWIQQQL